MGKILFLSNKKSPSNLKEKIETGFLVLDLKNLHELSENFNVTYNFKVVNWYKTRGIQNHVFLFNHIWVTTSVKKDIEANISVISINRDRSGCTQCYVAVNLRKKISNCGFKVLFSSVDLLKEGAIFLLSKDIGVGGWSRKRQFSLTLCSENALT